MTFKHLVSLQFEYKDFAFEENFKKLSSLVKKAPVDSIICAPELCLSNFCYDDMKKASEFSKKIEKEIRELSSDKAIALTMLEEEGSCFYNRAKVYYRKEVIYQRDKYKLFEFGKEHHYFQRGSLEDIKIFETEGVRFALLICFELRFIDLWERIKGADVILIPSLWGLQRKKHLEILSNALSLANQCFVITANSANDDMAKSSMISDPFGEFYKDDRREMLVGNFDKKVIKKMRRYLDIGIR